MRTTTVPFNLRAWRYRMALTQAEAAERVGLSPTGYRHAEYRSDDRGTCHKTLALLAYMLEHRTETTPGANEKL